MTWRETRKLLLESHIHHENVWNFGCCSIEEDFTTGELEDVYFPFHMLLSNQDFGQPSERDRLWSHFVRKDNIAFKLSQQHHIDYGQAYAAFLCMNFKCVCDGSDFWFLCDNAPGSIAAERDEARDRKKVRERRERITAGTDDFCDPLDTTRSELVNSERKHLSLYESQLNAAIADIGQNPAHRRLCSRQGNLHTLIRIHG